MMVKTVKRQPMPDYTAGNVGGPLEFKGFQPYILPAGNPLPAAELPPKGGFPMPYELAPKSPPKLRGARMSPSRTNPPKPPAPPRPEKPTDPPDYQWRWKS